MKLDPTVMRTMQGQDFRVLEAVEKGMQKHALVPVPLIAAGASLRHGGTGKILSGLLRDKLVSHDKSCGYDGYRLTNAGYDILALHNLKQRGLLCGFGDKIGTGKESDIYLGIHPNKQQQVVIKIHRLGRTSFRNVKKTRDYFEYSNHLSRRGNPPANNGAHSWLFLSRKSALKEYAFMKALYQVGYPTPQPLGQNRHIVVMSLIRGVPLYQVQSNHLTAEQAASIFQQASDLAFRLAQHGLVHCDLNEFNLLVDLSGIQDASLDAEHDPYVRHSGMSVVAEQNPGMQNARGPWEDASVAQFGPQNQESEETAHSENDDPPPEPKEYLENGQAKPIVTLIDFPQMVSTKHPNAKELYERDTTCLYKFFTHKLHCHIPPEEEANLLLKWEQVQERLGQQSATDDSASVCLASKAQLRLDQELQASGYSPDDVKDKDLELFYFSAASTVAQDTNGDDAVVDEGSEEDDPIESAQITRDSDELESVVSSVSKISIIPSEQLANLNREQLQEQARLRVAQQLATQKKKSRQKGAFRKHNSNKSFVKGKRVFDEFGV